MNKAIVLTDGEHYPAVTHDAIEASNADTSYWPLSSSAALRKIGSDADLARRSARGARRGLSSGDSPRDSRYRPDEVVDLSDEPVVGYKERFAIASVVLANGAVSGADFQFSPLSQLPG